MYLHEISIFRYVTDDALYVRAVTFERNKQKSFFELPFLPRCNWLQTINTLKNFYRCSAIFLKQFMNMKPVFFVNAGVHFGTQREPRSEFDVVSFS